LNREANIGPFAPGYAIVTAPAEGEGEAALGLKEAALVTPALPWNLGCGLAGSSPSSGGFRSGTIMSCPS
jgi:hypothetical protein